MAQIEQSVIEEVRARADIIDVVSQYVSLKRAGLHYKGLCPFHSEKTPSFTVNPERQIYKCFGCGAGGDVFRFLMDSQQMAFGEAIRELARQYGVAIKLTESDPEQEQERVSLRKINQEASLFFQACLKSEHGAEARAYLQQRGISEHFWQRFQLGYAPQSWDQLLHHLQGLGFSDTLLAKSGLFKSSETSGRLYDFFRHRVMFPIVGVNGDLLAFGGRTLDPELGAKYINSPETPIYQKGQHVYGLNLAKQAIRQKDRAILVEGYLDVITAHQFGFAETVAALGTALTPDQARQLLRFSESKTILMAYDADTAGQKAADRGAEILEQVTQGTLLRLQVIQIPDQEDPDTFLHKFGAEAFEQVLSQAQAFTAHYIDKLLASHDLSNPVDKSLAAKACLQTLLKIADPVLREEYLRYVAERLQLEESTLREQIQVQQGGGRGKRGYRRKATAAVSAAPVLPLADRDFVSELGLLNLLIEHPDKQDLVLAEVQALRFNDTQNEELRQYLVAMADAGLKSTWQELFGVFTEGDMHLRLTEMSENPSFQHLDFEKSLADFSRNVKLKCLGSQMALLSQEIQHLAQSIQADGEGTGEVETHHYQEKMLRYMELTQTYQRLKQMSLG